MGGIGEPMKSTEFTDKGSIRRTRPWRLAAGLLLLWLPAMPVWALDIDRIEVASVVGEPLRAEIPLLIENADELRTLQVGLASSTTFARIGLARPQGAVADLRFDVDRNPRAPRIRVSTAVPVQQEFLTFLIQLEWDGGRMVREFSLTMTGAPRAPEPAAGSAPVQAPMAAAPQASLPTAVPLIDLPADAAPVAPAPLQPPVVPMASPAPATTAAIAPVAQAPVAPAATSVPAPQPIAPAAPIPVFDRRSGRTIRGEAPAPAPAAPAATPTAAAVATPVPLAASTGASPATAAPAIGPVAAGQNLTRIAREMVAPGQSLDQVMVALMRANPQAFAHGNIHQLQRGARLRVPSAAEIAQYNAAQAQAVVREQTQLWLDGKAAQTPVLAGLPAPAAVPPAPAPAQPPRVAQPAAASLQILPPPAGSASQAGNQSGAQQAADAVATAYAQRAQEITDLQQRVQQLEALNRTQQGLIESQQSRLGMAGAMPSRFGWLGWLLAVGALSLIAGFWVRGLRDRRAISHGPTWHATAAADAKSRGPASV